MIRPIDISEQPAAFNVDRTFVSNIFISLLCNYIIRNIAKNSKYER